MRNILCLVIGSAIVVACGTKSMQVKNPVRVEEGERSLTTPKPRTFQSVANDPLNVREYTLKNGLKVFLSVNKDEPRIQTYVSVKAGGTSDPSHATGLAHYLEHMLFKGTSKIGAVDFEKEKVEIDKIKNLYEVYRNTTDTLKRKELYAQIDSISQIAAKYVAANEFDQLHSAIGAQGTNAYTTHDNTVYLTKIPSNQLENWAKLESERFRAPVLRLFHTELEAVYEEKNRSQDNHYRQQYYALLRELYKKHNYGLQTTIGTIDHLKNPSMIEIEKYFYKYYVPNNMAVILAGDFNPDSAISVIEKYFGGFEPAPVEEYRFEKEDSIKKAIEVNINAPDASSLMMAYRLGGAGSKEVYLAQMVDMVLNNSKAGLIDLNINQKQKAVGVYSGVQVDKDYSMHVLGGSPTKGQELKDLKELILSQIELVKKGEFPDWLIPAIINDFKVSEIKRLYSNRNRAAQINEAFSKGLSWEQKVNEIAELEKITKQEVIDFANKFYNENYVVVYKNLSDEPLNRKKVKKPQITPLDIPQDNHSEYFLQFNKENNPDPIEPSFVDYQKEIQTVQVSKNIPLYYLKNSTNELFTLRLVFPVGSYHNPKLSLAAAQAELLGTSRYTAAELAQEMYKLGMDFKISVGQKESHVTLSGLSGEFEKSLALFREIMGDLQPDQNTTDGLIQKTLQQRENSLKNPKELLWNGMQQFAVFGDKSPLKSESSNKELLKLKSADLLAEIEKMISYEFEALYYGNKSVEQVVGGLEGSVIFSELKKGPGAVEFKRSDMTENRIYVLDYDLKTAEILMLSKGDTFNKDELSVAKVFNEYYGGGMASVIFQEIREKKALAYSSFAAYTSARDTVKPQYTYAYLGTQTDKAIEAVDAMMGLLDEMPVDTLKFKQSISSLKQQLASDRMTRASKLYGYLADRKLGYSYSKSKDLYEGLDKVEIEDIINFHKAKIAGNKYSIVIVANSKDIDLKGLGKYGKVEVLKVEDLYPY